jgi:hypothetical protein
MSVWIVHTYQDRTVENINVLKSFHELSTAKRFVLELVVKDIENDTDGYMEWIDEGEYEETFDSYNEYVKVHTSMAGNLIEHAKLAENDETVSFGIRWRYTYYTFTKTQLV